MEKEYNIRGITIEDYPIINEWWKLHGLKAPKSSRLPMNGLGGFVIEKESRILAVVYLYLTNSTVGYFDHLISNPDYKGKDRYDLIMKLFNHVTDVAIKAGCEEVWFTTAIPGVIKRAKELCLKTTLNNIEENRVVIYAYIKE